MWEYGGMTGEFKENFYCTEKRSSRKIDESLEETVDSTKTQGNGRKTLRLVNVSERKLEGLFHRLVLSHLFSLCLNLTPFIISSISISFSNFFLREK
jgi:hypothetical protein